MVQLYSRDGGEFAVNGNTTGFQGQPATIRLASGQFVIVWTSLVSTGIFEVRGQLYGADGTPVGGEFAVTSVNGNLGDPRVEALSTGGFIVTWTYDLHDGSGTTPANGTALRIHGQIFDSAAGKVGGELTLTSGTLTNHSDSQLVALADGAFAVSYTRATSTNNVIDNDVVVQRFDSAGAPTGGLTVLSASSTGSQSSTALARLAGGGFIAVWHDSNSSAAGDSSALGVKGQLFDSAGAKVGAEFLVNTVTNGQQYQPSVAALASGGFVVAWIDLSTVGPDPIGNEIKAQIYTAGGAKVGGEFLVNSVTRGHQVAPQVAGLADGSFVVTWQDQSITQADVKAQAFSSTGAKLGIEFVVSTDNAGVQGAPVLASLADGGFVAAWNGVDADGSGVKAQVFGADAGSPTDIVPSSAALNENAVENLAVATLSAIGAANSTFTYQLIADSTGGAFRIEGDKLVVDDNAKLDFETAPEVTVTVRATDLNGQSHDEAIVLSVTDVVREKRFSAGEQFLVNVTEAGSQGAGSIVGLAGGGFASVWTEFGSTGARTLLRLFDSSAAPTSGEIVLANTWLDSFSVEPLASGGLVVIRRALNEPPGTYSIKAQVYNSAGQSTGVEMVVGSTANGFPGDSSIVQLSTGGYAIVWVTYTNEVHAQLFNAAGSPVGAEFNVTKTFTQTPFSLVATPDGGFAAAWVESETQSGGIAKVQFYDSAGAPSRPPLSIEMGADPGNASLLALADGSYIFAWVELAGEESGFNLYAVMGQPIGANGAAAGDPLLITGFVSEADTGEVEFAVHPDGGFVVSWPAIGVNEGGTFYGVAAQLFDKDGAPVGSPLEATESGFGGILAVLANGSIVSSWTGFDSNESGGFARLFSPANEPVFDNSGNDVLAGDGNPNFLDGGGGDDQLSGLGGDDELIGGAGSDLLDGGTGADEMTGGAGNDVYQVDDAGDVVIENGGEGIDEVRTSLGSYSLAGSWIENLTATNDSAHDFRGSDADNVLTGGGGNDLLRLNDAGADIANGGAGNDILYFGSAFTGADIANGGDGRDVLVLQGNYTLTLSATNIANLESISLQSGARTTWGDTANNFYDYNITMADANVTAGQQLIVNGQSLRAGEDFTFDGSAETGDGKFLVYGGNGVDHFTGGSGNDVFFFEGDRWGPSDTVNGGAGRDALIISSGTGLAHIEFGATSLTSIESISVNARFATDPSARPSYELVLDNGNVAPGAALILNASSLTDPIQTVSFDGSAVHDGVLIMFGGAGSDVLIGGDGADRFEGRLGGDRLTGGAGADTFRYTAVADSDSATPDQILDFASGSDKIDLSAIDADGFTGGDQAFHWIGSEAFSAQGSASAGELRAWLFDGSWYVEGDTNGDGFADLVIKVTMPAAPVVQEDFVF